MSAIMSSTERRTPDRIVQVSGLWQYWQRRGQPARNATNRIPGPSTPVEMSQEWTDPIVVSSEGAMERPGDDVALLLPGEPDEVDRVPGHPDGQLRIALGVGHG